MALKPGRLTPSEFSGSMAQAMEDALRLHWTSEMGSRPIPFTDRFLKLLFVAIAQGVVRHLEENPEAFKVTLGTADEADGQVSDIETIGVSPKARNSST